MAANVSGSVGLTPGSRPRIAWASAAAPSAPSTVPARARRRPCPQHEAHHRPARVAQREAHAHLARPPADRPRDHPVEARSWPDRGRARPVRWRWSPPCAAGTAPRRPRRAAARVDHRQVLSRRRPRAACARRQRGVAVGAEEHAHARAVALGERQVERAAAGPPRAAASSTSPTTPTTSRSSPVMQPPADGVAARPQPAGEGLVDDRHRARGGAVGGGERRCPARSGMPSVSKYAGLTACTAR